MNFQWPDVATHRDRLKMLFDSSWDRLSSSTIFTTSPAAGQDRAIFCSKAIVVLVLKRPTARRFSPCKRHASTAAENGRIDGMRSTGMESFSMLQPDSVVMLQFSSWMHFFITASSIICFTCQWGTRTCVLWRNWSVNKPHVWHSIGASDGFALVLQRKRKIKDTASTVQQKRDDQARTIHIETLLEGTSHLVFFSVSDSRWLLELQHISPMPINIDTERKRCSRGSEKWDDKRYFRRSFGSVFHQAIMLWLLMIVFLLWYSSPCWNTSMN